MRTRLLHGKNAVLHAHATMAAAGRAGGSLAILRTAACAFTAGHQGWHVDLLLDAEDRLLKIQFHQVAQVGTASRTPAACAAHAEDVAEDVTEDVADIAVEAASTTAHAVLEGRMSVLVVGRALLAVAKHLVGFLGFLEALLRLRVIRATIRMALHRQATECLLQFVIRRGLLNAEDFVIATLCGHGRTATGIKVAGKREGRNDNRPSCAAGRPALPPGFTSGRLSLR